MPQSPAQDGPSRRGALKLVGAGLAAVGVGSSVGLAESDRSSGAATDAKERSPNQHAATQATAAVEKQTETEAVTVTIDDQSPHYGTVYVADVTLPEAGFVALHDASFFIEGQVLGVSAPLPAGTYQNLPIVLDEMPEKTLNVAAIPHQDAPSDGVFTHPEDGDTPFVGESGVVHDIAELQPE